MSSTFADPPPGPPLPPADAPNPATPPPTNPTAGTRHWWGQATAMVGAGLLLAAVFAPWADPSRRALHTRLTTDATTLTVGMLLVMLATVAAVGALSGDRGWPRLVTGVAAFAIVVVHLDAWAAVQVPTGAWLALAAAMVELVAAALATATPPALRFGDLPRRNS